MPSWGAIDALIPERTRLRDYDAAAGRALVELAHGSCGGPPTVVLNVENGADVAALSSGGFVGAETAKRLACDAKIQIGERTSRTIPPATRRIWTLATVGSARSRAVNATVTCIATT